MRKKYSNDEILFLQEQYPEKGAKYCANKLNRTIASIKNKASRLKLSVNEYGYKEAIKNRKTRGPRPLDKLKVSPIKFMSDFNQETAYILGLIWADGWVGKNVGRIVVNCIEDDGKIFLPIFMKTGKWHLHKKEPLGRKPQYSIYTSNKVLCNFLSENNYNPHNVESADKILSKIPSILHQYWFRGLIDGDGSFYINKKNRDIELSISGPHNQNWSFVEDIYRNLGIKYNISIEDYNGHKSSKIRVRNKNGIHRFGNYIYKNYIMDKIGLRRKYNKYIEILDYLNL